jgi:hypothetical protein
VKILTVAGVITEELAPLLLEYAVVLLGTTVITVNTPIALKAHHQLVAAPTGIVISSVEFACAMKGTMENLAIGKSASMTAIVMEFVTQLVALALAILLIMELTALIESALETVELMEDVTC